jgi:hypothetical protein
MVETVVVLLLLGVFVSFSIWSKRKDLGSLELLRRTARKCLHTTAIQTTTSGHAFDGSEVEIVDNEENFATINDYIVSYDCSYFVRDKLGEYFLFIYQHGAKPFVKHTSHQIAQIKLKDKYIPPPRQ